MPVERYYSKETLEDNITIELAGSEFHHLAHVIRSKKGDSIELVDGKGHLGFAVIQDIKKDKALLFIENLETQSMPTQLILAQALPKPNRMDYILEKGTELGVDEFWFFPGELSQKKELFPNQLERASSITIAAMKQCGRLSLPKIHVYPSLSKWKPLPHPAFFGDLSPNAPLLYNSWHPAGLLPVIFCTGPESGFSTNEIGILKKLGAQGVKLHENVLRTDTASIMALSIISHFVK